MSASGTDATDGDERTDEDLENEIQQLQHKLQESQRLLQSRRAAQDETNLSRQPLTPTPDQSSASHFLLLLSDSALPLGSFAFSSGLESYLAHTRGSSSFTTSFLPLSLSSFASTTLPFLLAAHRSPSSLAALDDALDATIICTVGRRASVAQGRALLSIWERSFAPAVGGADASVLRAFAAELKATARDPLPRVAAHLAPLFGAIARVVGLGVRQTAYVFLLAHVKAVVSAAVRASVFGPYQAQRLLASGEVRGMIGGCVEREGGTRVEDAGQVVPVMDLWVGRHEVLYSRIFNS